MKEIEFEYRDGCVAIRNTKTKTGYTVSLHAMLNGDEAANQIATVFKLGYDLGIEHSVLQIKFLNSLTELLAFRGKTC